MKDDKFEEYIQSLSKEQLINKLINYKELYDITKFMLKKEEKHIDEYHAEIASLENDNKKLEDELKVYKILNEHNNIQEDEKELFTILSICSSTVILYLTLLYNLKISFMHFLLLIIPIFLFYMIINFFLTAITAIIHKKFFRDLTNNKKEKILAYFCPFLLAILFIIINIYA